ncbi:SCO family protein [Dyella monticola]|uniref:SCO family protein n=1 Tax=Dyella monticola TaxID=1927958 RepID=A0A370WXD4_9GAMM|nr:SCO family protein [Dyella monticola]RDS80794.1 SCO family protein [Dyella monticola]
MSGFKQALLLLLLGVYAAHAGATAPPPPRDLNARAGFDQNLGAMLPLDTMFTDAAGTKASLAHWMDGHPTLLMLGYFRCPHLCDVAQQGMAHAIAGSGLRPGNDMSVLFVSIDPRDTPVEAMAKQTMITRMQGDANAAHWHFLLGDAASVGALSRAIGYHYFYDARLDQYAHPAGLVIATAQGTVNQYLMGVNYVPQTLHLAVVAASHHTLGSMVDQLVLLCCGYDPATGRYTVTITRIMQGLGIGFVALLLLMFTLLKRHRPDGAP